MVVWAGAGVGFIDSIQPAEEVVRALVSEAAQIIDAAAAFVDRSQPPSPPSPPPSPPPQPPLIDISDI